MDKAPAEQPGLCFAEAFARMKSQAF